MDIKNAIDDIAKVLEPYATIIYLVGVAGTCVLASWAFLRGRLSTKDAEIGKLKNTIKYLEGENSKAEKSIERLKGELGKARNGLPEVALKRAEQQVRDGNEENANQIFMDWFRQKAKSITEVSRRLACWELSFSQDEQHGGAAVLCAERFITIACALQPKDRQLRNLKDDILISKYNQDPAGTEDDFWNRMWSLADEYANADPAILIKYAEKYFDTGNYHHALALWQRVTVILRRTAGPNDRDTLISQGKLASVLHALNRLEESEALLRETWEAMKKHLPPNDRDTLISQHNLAGVLHKLDLLEESEVLQREAWEAMKKHLRPDDPEMFCSQSCLASVLHALKRLKESEALQREAWGAMKEHLPPNHGYTLSSQSRLASVLHALKRPEEAEALATAAAPPGDDAGESKDQPRLSGDLDQSVLPAGLKFY